MNLRSRELEHFPNMAGKWWSWIQTQVPDPRPSVVSQVTSMASGLENESNCLSIQVQAYPETGALSPDVTCLYLQMLGLP